MKTTLKARNLELTDRLRGQIDRKLQRLDRIAHPDAEASVELILNASRANDSAHQVEVTFVNNGSVMRSVATGPTLTAAVDQIVDKLERQLVRTKQKPRTARSRADATTEVMVREATGSLADDEELSASRAPSVVKIKRFDMVPMFEEDAIARMEELGHAFFIFLNAETDGICVVYRRADGAYGLIEPVVEPVRGGRGTRS